MNIARLREGFAIPYIDFGISSDKRFPIQLLQTKHSTCRDFEDKEPLHTFCMIEFNYLVKSQLFTNTKLLPRKISSPLEVL